MPPTRRDAITAGGLFGLGQVTPSRFPYPGRPQPAPGIGPSQGQVVRANRVIVFGPNGGVFVYSGTPALGNPPIAWITNVSVSATDPFGNVLPQMNIGTLFAGSAVGFNGEVLRFQFNTGFTPFSSTALFPTGNSGLQIQSGQQTGADVASILTLASAAQAGQAIGKASIAGQLVSTQGTLAVPTEIITDTWHQVGTYINGWSGNANLDYRLAADDTIEINGRITNVAGTAGNSQVTTLTGYAPANRTEFAVGIDTNGTTHSLQLDTAGRFQVNTAVAAGGTVTVAVRIPRSAPA